jgi:hypothetical protein
MDAQTRIPKVYNPLEFEDGLAYLMKTDILKEVMYFSYDPNSLANLFPLEASEVREIIKMNRNGVKPESLKSDPEPHVPEFVTAVGDDSISRFDESRKRKKKRKPENRSGKDRRQGDKPQGKGRGDRNKEGAPKKQHDKSADKRPEKHTEKKQADA